MEYVVEVSNLRKRFCRSLKRSLVYGTSDVLRSMAGFPDRNPRLRKGEFWALDDISFRLKRGESLGLIGANGSGKSTLLRMLTGIFPPDHGEIRVRGRIASLIAVGAGFHPHMSGTENIYLNGVLLGLRRSEIKRCFDDIVAFAEIGEFIEAPVSTYSSGMRVRLGFAIAIHTRPEILLVDEVMSVGDTRFRRKASDAMMNLLENTGTTLILVSHNAFVVKQQCEWALLMNHGRQIFYGNVEEAYERYHEMSESSNSLNQRIKHGDFLYFRVVSGDGEHRVRSGEDCRIEFALSKDIVPESDVPITITIFDAEDTPVLNLQPANHTISSSAEFRFMANVGPLKDGAYHMQCKLGSQFQGVSLLRGYPFQVVGNPRQCNTAMCDTLHPLNAPLAPLEFSQQK